MAFFLNNHNICAKILQIAIYRIIGNHGSGHYLQVSMWGAWCD
jgi:hypothetical protein